MCTRAHCITTKYTAPTFALPEYMYACAVGPVALGLMHMFQAKHSYYIYTVALYML